MTYQRRRLWDTKEWRKIRDQVRARDGWRCQSCGRGASPGVRLTVHHAAGYDDPLEMAGLQTALCSRCHGRRTRADQLLRSGQRPASYHAKIHRPNRFADVAYRRPDA